MNPFRVRHLRRGERDESASNDYGGASYGIPVRCSRSISLEGLKFLGPNKKSEVRDMVVTVAVEAGVGPKGLAGRTVDILLSSSVRIAEINVDEEFTVPILPGKGGLHIRKDVWVKLRFKVDPYLTEMEGGDNPFGGTTKKAVILNSLEKKFTYPRDIYDADGARFEFLSSASNVVEFMYTYCDDK